MPDFFRNIVTFVKKHRKMTALVLVILITLPIIVTAVAFFKIKPYSRYILGNGTTHRSDVGLVLGAGISQNGKPYDELKARLDTAADALSSGTVNKLILSGDNRFVSYDEPSAMKRYLIEEKKVPEDKLFLDQAGRSTYESCERATKVFGAKSLIIFSANSHLPRAIYLCRSFDIDAYGIASGTEANNSTRRELLARVKALYNVHLVGERTILGDPIPLH